MFTIKGFQFKYDDHCIGLSTKNLKNDVTVGDFLLHKEKYEYNKIRTVVLDYVCEDYNKEKYDIATWETVCKVAKNLNCTCV